MVEKNEEIYLSKVFAFASLYVLLEKCHMIEIAFSELYKSGEYCFTFFSCILDNMSFI